MSEVEIREKEMKAEGIEFESLRPGMRIALQKLDGTIEAGRTIRSTYLDEDGGCWVNFTDGTALYEDPFRMSHRSTICIAVEA